MEEESSNNNRNKKRILYVILMLGLTAVVALVGTYAWFVGQDKVIVEPFEIQISSPDDLEISLDGATWNSTLTLNEQIVLGTATAGTHQAYTGNKNKWASSGLFPFSSNGADSGYTSGRLKLFIKNSVTATKGGYRFKADAIDNSTTESDGYVAFDLLIKNGTKANYDTTYDEDKNEAIYLTRDSSVTVTNTGALSPDRGVANSIRVAFKPVGRVKWDTTPTTTITGINCTTSATVTGLCTDQDTAIWEPNNTKHDSTLVTEYNERCKVRTAINTYKTSASDLLVYSCNTLENGKDSDTYVVNSAFASSLKTDIYDGHNYYTNGTLANIDTFTDTKKALGGDFRKTLFSLAPNSITKVRIYIYLEGQDLDNDSEISNGSRVAVKFGFTKDGFSTETTTDTPTLEDYTWNEIKTLSSELVAGTLTYAQLTSKYGIALGQTKVATINGEKHKFRLVGTNHDIDASGNTLGMTFEQVDLMNTGQKMKNSMSSSDSWENSGLKTTINSWTIESELDAVITAAKKSVVTSVSSGTQTYSTSKLWIMSETEITNAQTNTKGGTAEGTPYAYYASQSYSLASALKRQKGASVEYWLRSASNYQSSNSKFVVYKGTTMGSEASTSTRGVAVCFCI